MVGFVSLTVDGLAKGLQAGDPTDTRQVRDGAKRKLDEGLHHNDLVVPVFGDPHFPQPLLGFQRDRSALIRPRGPQGGEKGCTVGVGALEDCVQTVVDD